MKSSAVFIGTKEAINNAYGTDIQTKLKEYLDFLPKIYSKENLTNGENTQLKNVEYIFSTWGMAELNEEQIAELLPNLKAIFYAAGTVKYFARPFLDRGVKIFSAWGANAVPVAEVTVAEIVLANKGFFQTLHNGNSSVWSEHNNGNPHPGNFNTNVGIIGAGMIGTLVIKKLKEYKLNVKVFDKFMTDERANELGVEKVNDITELFGKCHVVSNHLANNSETVNIIDKNCFDKMDENGIFINTGRGRQVVEKDLINALKEKPSRIAVLDVTYPEPPEKNSELYTMPNVFLSPHLAGSIGNEVERMGEYMYNEFEAFINGKPTKYEVCEKMLETMA